MCDVIPDVSVDIPSDLSLVKKEPTENIQVSQKTFRYHITCRPKKTNS